MTSTAERLAGLLGRGLALGLGAAGLATPVVGWAQPPGPPAITGPAVGEAAARAAERRRARLLDGLAGLEDPTPAARAAPGPPLERSLSDPAPHSDPAPLAHPAPLADPAPGPASPTDAPGAIRPAATGEPLPAREPRPPQPVAQDRAGAPTAASAPIERDPVQPAPLPEPAVPGEPTPLVEAPAGVEAMATVAPLGDGVAPAELPAAGSIAGPDQPLDPQPLPEALAAPDIDDPEAIEPEAGITFRRDPLELPLLDESRWIEWVLSVDLNGRELDEGFLFIEEPRTGRLAVELSVAREWRLLIDPDALLSFEGVPFLPLDAIEGLESSLDEFTLVLDLDIPPEAFETARIDVDERPRVSPTPGTGGFFDYDLLLTGG